MVCSHTCGAFWESWWYYENKRFQQNSFLLILQNFGSTQIGYQPQQLCIWIWDVLHDEWEIHCVNKILSLEMIKKCVKRNIVWIKLRSIECTMSNELEEEESYWMEIGGWAHMYGGKNNKISNIFYFSKKMLKHSSLTIILSNVFCYKLLFFYIPISFKPNFLKNDPFYKTPVYDLFCRALSYSDFDDILYWGVIPASSLSSISTKSLTVKNILTHINLHFCSYRLFSSGWSFPLDSISRSTHHITTMKVETLMRRGWHSVHALASWTELSLEASLEASRIEFYQLLLFNHRLISNWNQEKCNT